MAEQERIFEGRNLEEALQSAASSLGIPEAELHYEIVEQGRRGVLGFGAKSVQIRIKPPMGPPPAEEKPAGPRRARSPRKKAAPRSDQRTPAERPAEPEDEPSGEPTGEPHPVAETVRRMFLLMGLEIEVSAIPADGGVTLKFQGRDRKVLTARNGELLSAFQLLLNRMSRRAWPDVGRIYLGGNGPRRRRDDELIELVREVAQQVAKTAKTRKLQPMNAYERRLVHVTVREFPGLTSSSDGDGPMKRVRISKVQNAI